jgi:hypothetical protein
VSNLRPGTCTRLWRDDVNVGGLCPGLRGADKICGEVDACGEARWDGDVRLGLLGGG